MSHRTKVISTAALVAAIPLGLAGVVWLAGINLKRAFLRVAGFVVEGVKDDVAVFAGVSVALLIFLWLVIVARSIYEARAERNLAQSSDNDTPTANSHSPSV